jgi:hypothetical protein
MPDDLPSVPNFFNRRLELRRKAIANLEQRIVDSGLPPKGGGRTVEDVLVPGLSPEAEESALTDLADGRSGELRPSKEGFIPFCSAESSAAIAINTFAAFTDQPFADPLLGLTLQSPRFEQRFRISGIKSSIAPILDVVVRDDDQAVVIDSRVVEPWFQQPDVDLSPQIDQAAEATSPGVVATIEALRDGSLTYLTIDAAELIRHLLGISSAIAKERLPAKCTFIALHWVPADPGRLAELFTLIDAEMADFIARVSDQPVTIRSLSYAELWASWAGEGAPEWLRAHAGRLDERYGVGLGDR